MDSKDGRNKRSELAQHGNTSAGTHIMGDELGKATKGQS